jgi:hypothetical protein
MKKAAVASVAVILCVLSSATTVSACGDKLLYLSRIYRHHRPANNTVAIFARPNSLLENAAALKLDKIFHEEGYHLLLVNSEHDLAMALQSGAADVVISDIADVEFIQQRVSAAKIPIIPVIGKDDPRSADNAKRYVAVIKSPVKPDKFLDALDRAFESKEMRRNRPKAQAIRVSLR